jgi:heme exporter protein D
MLDLGPHASFIIAAYGVTFVAVAALVLATLEDDRKQRRKLAELERLGIRRRSASPTVKTSHTVKTAVKPKAAKAPAKRKPATPRKTRS